MELKFGYMGLGRPLSTTWSDGRNVTVYPDGRVINNETGDFIREADKIENKVSNVSFPVASGNQNFMFFGMFIIGIVAIVALSRSSKWFKEIYHRLHYGRMKKSY